MATTTEVIARGRLIAESRMDSTATVRRKTGAVTTVARMEVPEWEDVHTALPMRLAAPSVVSPSRTVTVGLVSTQVAVRRADFPATTDDLRDGDLIDVTAGEHEGLVLQILEATGKDQATARRVPVFEVQRPEEWS